MKTSRLLSLFIAILLGSILSFVSADTCRPSYVIKNKGDKYTVYRLDMDVDGRHSQFYVNAGDTIYPLADEYVSKVRKYELERYIAGTIGGIPVLVDKDFTETLVWSGDTAELKSDIDKREENLAKETFESMIYGENHLHGSPWYYFLGFFVVTWLISLFTGGSSKDGDEKDSEESTGVLLVLAVVFTLLFVVEYAFCFFGMSNINNWMRGEKGSEFLNFLLIIPKCLSFVILTIYQFRVWEKLISRIGHQIGGRSDYSVSVVIVLLVVAAIGLSCFFFIKHLPTVMYVGIALIILDLIFTFWLNRRNIAAAIITTALYCAGVLAMFELLAIFGLLLLVVVSIVAAVGGIMSIIQNPGKVTHLVRKDGRVIGKIYEGSSNIHFTNGSDASVSEVSSSHRIKIDPIDE